MLYHAGALSSHGLLLAVEMIVNGLDHRPFKNKESKKTMSGSKTSTVRCLEAVSRQSSAPNSKSSEL